MEKEKRAFPGIGYENPIEVYYSGMSLNDYFAAKAMQALIMLDPEQRTAPDAIADRAYYFADVMLANRKQFKNPKPAPAPAQAQADAKERG